MVIERASWPDTEELASNAHRLRAAFAQRIRAYEAAYQVPSEKLGDELAAGRLRETADIARWLIAISAYRKLVHERQARVE